MAAPVRRPARRPLYRFDALWTDGYNVNDQTTQDRQDSYSGFSGRVFPQAGANWRLPLVRDGETVQQIVEPIAEVILAPNWGNPSRIPNEDSQDFELQESNLFGFNRLPGIDVVDEGPRVNYGLTWTLLGFGGKSASAFVGQSYQPYQDDTFGKGTGLQDNVSDIVTSIDLVPTSWLDLIYRNRLDHKTFEFHRNELTARVGTDAARLRTTYVRYDGQPQNDLQGSEEIQYGLDTRLTRFWRSQHLRHYRHQVRRLSGRSARGRSMRTSVCSFPWRWRASSSRTATSSRRPSSSSGSASRPWAASAAGINAFGG